LTAPAPGEIGGALHGRLIPAAVEPAYEVTTAPGTGWCAARRSGTWLATAHDMEREYRVITALRDTSVPVP